MKKVSFKSGLLASLLFSGFMLITSCKEENKSDINNDPTEDGMGGYGAESPGGDVGAGTDTAADTTDVGGAGSGNSGNGSTGSGAGAQPTVPGGVQ